MQNLLRFSRSAPAILAAMVLLVPRAGADVVINEVMAAASDRLLQWDAAGKPKLGTGPQWNEVAFNDASWRSGPGPIGYGVTSPTLGTNVATQMQYLTPTLYLRKTFNVSAATAALPNQLQLIVNFNDGFICYLNGVEVTRRWAGPAGQFHYHDQPAYNPDLANTTTNPTTLYSAGLNIGAASTRLVEGENVLAIHGLNFSTASANFVIDARLQMSGSPLTVLVANNDTWKYLPGVVEPSGALYDPALLSSGTLNVPWGRTGFNDEAWPSGPGPLRAGPAGAGTVIPGVIGQTPSIYGRTVFTVTEAQAAQTQAMQLIVDYDDGFVAYINGVEVARANLGPPNTFVPHGVVATATRDFGAQVAYTIDPPAKLLVAGPNVLSIQAHNVAINDPDIYLKADLRLGGVTLAANTGTWTYLAGLDEPVPADSDGTEDSPESPDSATDWVELFNNGPVPVSLNGWRMTDNSTNRAKWIFPDVSIPAGGYLVVICDERNLTSNPGGYLHTNFKLSRSGGFLGLYDASGTVVQTFPPALPRASAFHSYGRNAGGTYVYLDPPTPGAANASGEFAGFVADPVFSIPAGFYTSNQNVSITNATSGATIRFTVDGSEPSLTNGVTYASPISVTAQSVSGNFVLSHGNRCLRARAFKTGLLPSRVVTNNVVVGESTARLSLPAMFLTAEPSRALYLPYGVFAINSNSAGNYSNNIWSALGDPSQYHNPNLRGRFIERPANMALLYPSGAMGFSTDFGLRCAGSAFSRPRYKFPWLNDATPNFRTPWASIAVEKPQLNVFFRGDYGASPVNFPIFPGAAVTSFENLRLRAGKNDISNPWVRDELMRRLWIDTGNIGSHGINTTLWINGVYKGYYNVTERLREDFFQRWYGSSKPWDVWVVNDTASGDSLMLQEMVTFLRTNAQTQLANYQGAQTRIDLGNFADYLLTNLYGCTGDWPHNNYTMARERSANARWVCALWDGEGAFGLFQLSVLSNQFSPPAASNTQAQAVIVGSGASSPTEEARFTLRTMYTLLRASPEFRLLMADHIQKLFFNGGALTDANVFARKEALRTEMLPLIPSFNDTVFNTWINGTGNITRNGGGNSPSRRQVLLSGYTDDAMGGAFVPAHFVAEGIWPSTKAPNFSQFGGAVASGFQLTLTNPNASGTIYYTTTGADPRAAGTPGAAQGLGYLDPLSITQTTVVKARVLIGGIWSPLTEATFIVAQPPALLITEIMYHPLGQGTVADSEFEFLEIKNVGEASVSLSGVNLAGGLAFTFPAGSTLAPGAFAVLVRNAAQFTARYPGVPIAGVYGPTQNLSNAGATLNLRDIAGSTIFSVTYSDQLPWPVLADGYGNSLVPIAPDINPAPSVASNWRASTNLGGSPGADDPASTTPAIVVNEIRANSAAGQKDAVELYNPTAQPADIGGWFLSDNAGNPTKYRIPDGMVIPADGYVVFDETNFNPGGGSSFAFDGNGEEVRLSAATAGGVVTGYAHGFSFGASAPGVSLGRFVNSVGVESFPAQIAPSFGALNPGPLVGPVVLSELMYQPGVGGDEFVEIRNLSNASIPLYDPAFVANAWRIQGISFTFPQGVVLAPREVALVTPLTEAAWRTKYGTPAAIRIFGPYAGNLADNGERIALQKPGTPYVNGSSQTVVPNIDVDAVNYSSTAPWPTTPAGAGPSLERSNWRAYADDPASWRASPVSGGVPGVPTKLPFAAWQSVYFTAAQLADPNVSGPDADFEQDGLTTFREYAQGLDPLAFDASAAVEISLMKDGAAGPFLTLRYRRNLAAQNVQFFGDTAAALGSWTLGNGIQVGTPITNADGTETVTLRDPIPQSAGGPRFLRLRMLGN